MLTASADTTALIWDLPPTTQTQPSRFRAQELDCLLRSLAINDGAKAYDAICNLAAAPDQAVPFLARSLGPTPQADPKRIRQLIADLDSDRFGVREMASRELARMGELAETTLREAYARETSLEVRRRLREVLEKLKGPVTSTQLLQSLRAIEVLEGIGNPEACEVLRKMAQGASKALRTVEAKASLERIKRRRAKAD